MFFTIFNGTVIICHRGRGRVRRLGDHMVFREGVVVGNPLTGTEFEEGTGTANERRGGGGRGVI